MDLVYLDPPFNKNASFGAPIGSKAAGAFFKDIWNLDDIDVLDHERLRHTNKTLHDVILAAKSSAGDDMMAYLLMMSTRLIELKRVLKDTGSIYLHCDPTANSYLRLVMDTIFGRENYQREIIWKMPRPSGYKTKAGNWIRNHDTLLYYTVSSEFVFNKQYEPYEESYLKNFNQVDAEGPYWLRGGKKRRPGKGYNIGSVWTDIHSLQTQSVSRAEGVGYPTQKPVALLERIINASSNPGDIVLDPFCGCATAAIAAENLKRKWIGIDLSAKAVELVRYRLNRDLGFDSLEAIARTDLPQRTDLGKLPPYRSWHKSLYGQCGGNCAGCGVHYLPKDLEVDHIVSRSDGGTDHELNLQLLCGNCNRRKGKGSMSKLMDKLMKDREGL